MWISKKYCVNPEEIWNLSKTGHLQNVSVNGLFAQARMEWGFPGVMSE